jgi:hypothetical protein
MTPITVFKLVILLTSQQQAATDISPYALSLPGVTYSTVKITTMTIDEDGLFSSLDACNAAAAKLAGNYAIAESSPRITIMPQDSRDFKYSGFRCDSIGVKP